MTCRRLGILFFFHVSPEDCTLVIRLSGKYHYLLNLFTGSSWRVVQLRIRQGARPLAWNSPLVLSQAWLSYRLGQLLR